jgi:hypothetical protein
MEHSMLLPVRGVDAINRTCAGESAEESRLFAV